MGGVSIALDDFGTGYSSLRHLSDFDVDRVKIDRSFVHEIGGAASGDRLVQAIIDLAQAVGLKTTAEGVETAEQNAFLTRIGCDSLQGFLLAAPMPEQELLELLATAAVEAPATGRNAKGATVTNEPARVRRRGRR
jgi:EAL domain-containing protein (putative c-di-GMP-specific phosphodiesterase class I)